MKSGATATPHLDDGDLIRLLDAELDEAAGARARTHLGTCDRCGRRLDQLEARAAALAATLRDTAASLPPPPQRVRAAVAAAAEAAPIPLDRRRRDRRATHSLLRAAAIIALLLGIGFGVPPVRAWVGERIAAWTGADTAEPGVAAPEAATVSFVPATRDLVIRFDAPGGVARFSVGAGDRLTADLEGAGAAARLLVVRDGIRVEGGGALDYRFSLPAGTRNVRVELEDVTLSDRRVQGPGEAWAVPIRRR